MRIRIFVLVLMLASPALAADLLDVLPPSVRVRGVPGSMSIQPRECRTLPATDARARIVGVALQQWDFFGSRISDYAEVEDDDPPPGQRRGRRPRLSPEEAARVAPSIAGMGRHARGVLDRGAAERPVEWRGRHRRSLERALVGGVHLMGDVRGRCWHQRAVPARGRARHHTYIDQAIRARDGHAPHAAFVAYDPGETTIGVGDLLCSSRRPVYRTIADRRRQMGVGARSHCDVVVRVDEPGQRVHAIGGNVRGVVSLKVFPAIRAAGRPLRVGTGDEDRPMFAHLKLR